MSQNILHGARAQLIIAGKIVGLFSQCSWGHQYDAVPSYILGAFAPAEITYTAQEAISVNATGFRVVDAGAYRVAGLPKLQELMTYQDISLSIFDRQSGKEIFTVTGVKAVGYNSGVSARALSDFSVSFIGRIASDEQGAQQESAGASTLLSGT